MNLNLEHLSNNDIFMFMNMNLRKIFLSLFAFILLFSITKNANALTLDKSRVYYFHGDGCPHCANVNEFFEKNDILQNYPVETHEIYNNRENAKFLSDIYYEYKIPSNKRGVPAMFYPKSGELLVGDKPIIDNFDTKITEHLNTKINVTSNNTNSNTENEEKTKNDLTIVAVITGALVDSINPCAFAVLLLLLSSILAGNLENKGRALKAGLLFSLSIFLSYLAMGLGLYKALNIGNLPNYFMKVIGGLAIIVGLFNIKDYINYGGGGFTMEVPRSWRPKMKELLVRVTSPAGAFFIGFVISLFLLPCTSGPYIVVLGMLSQRHLFAKALGYLVIYNLIFVLPMVIISFAVYKGADVVKLQKEREKRIKLLHLIAGILILGIGVLLLLGII